MRSISHCINKQLADICKHSVQLEELSIKLKQFLPQNLATECQVGSFKKGCLVITTPNAVWASQLRYAVPGLRDHLRKEAGLYQLSTIKVVVVEPTIQYEKTMQKKQHKLSEKAKAIIINESQSCTYEPMQKALLHLADSSD